MDVVDALAEAEQHQTREWLTLLEIEDTRKTMQAEHLARLEALDAMWRRQKTAWVVAKARVDDLAALMDKEYLG